MTTLEDVQKAHAEWQKFAVRQWRSETGADRIAEDAAYAMWRKAYHTYRMEEYGESS